MSSTPGLTASTPELPTTATRPKLMGTCTNGLDLEKLGRERPSHFSSRWSELAFCFSIVMSQILAEFFITGSNLLLPTLVTELGIPEASTIWPTTALSLVVCATLLIFGRLTDMYGGYLVYNVGAIWLTISSILAGVSTTWLMLIICRALQGLALGALLPSGMMILGSTYRPGPRKNLVFSFLTWRWYFYIGAILSAIMAASSIFSVPRDYYEKKELGIRMDWAGLVLSITGTTLFVFAIADSSYAPQGWKTPYIIVFFVLGMILLGVMAYIEGWVVQNPLLPGDIFHVKHMAALVIALLFLYGSLGIFLLYGVLYMSDFMGGSPLQIVAWTAPMGVGGLILSAAGGFILHKVSGTLLMLISCLGYVGSGLLFAIIPIGGNYWAYIFPAMICGTVAIDISFNLANIFITTSLPKARQGLAGALIYCTLHLGIAVMLGFADIVQTQMKYLGVRKSYKVVFWFQTGLAVVGLFIVLLLVRIRHAKSELTAEEIQAQGTQSSVRRDNEEV
ncbi:Major facilitator superfamily domain general substrate transporter [Penicillium maclennaniae]|uniref:Major facilitator superfamily domain general substrate transporter n=1 Tax=Penicillium maclennaniae TaxID=1343394 RepID=UPI0025425F4C|nr:Major facilitator superfamily domain general substrate transporter [Penicillium maclennaniae]KAJ5675183.1 Major facilitator superfamily domain general substrate transporter [Penicillium maclennaniae]